MLWNVACFYQIPFFTAVKIWTVKIYRGKNLGGKNSMSTDNNIIPIRL